MTAAGGGRRGLFAWCLYDWANSAFPTVITTFVFGAYFTQGVAPDPTRGTAWWGHALALAGLSVAVLSPMAGAIADRSGPRKPWLLTFTLAAALAAALMWFVRPDPAAVPLALALLVLGSIAFELAMTFYNAMLPDIAPPDRIGRMSGWGWGLGYAGGLACLALALALFIQADTPAFGLDKSQAEHVRAVGPMVAAWFLLFAWPLFAFTPDRRPGGVNLATAARQGLAQLAGTLRAIGRYGNILRFLLGSLFYLNGLQTLFAFGGIYAAGVFRMTFDEIVIFGIALNVTAGLGAAAFAWIDDRIGAKPTILIALAGLLLSGSVVLLASDVRVFWIAALVLGAFIGPAQAAGRSLMARLAPPDMTAEMFGLYQLAGKATNFLGPLALGQATLIFASQRAGMATILVFLAVGFVLILTVAEPARRAETAHGEGAPRSA